MISLLLLLFTSVHANNKIDPSVYRQRENGRTGNWLYEEMFWRLKTARHGVSFTKIARDLPWPFSELKPFVTAQENMDLGYNFSLWTDEVPPYPHSFKYYRDNREQIMRQLPPPRPGGDCDDVVVHLRLEDVFNDHPDYTALPLHWYIDVFDKIFKESSSRHVCLIGKPIDAFQQRMMRRVWTVLVERYVDEANVFVHDKNSVQRDVELMYGCRTFVGSTSTLWFWPVWTAPTLQEAHIPIFLLTSRDMQFENYTHPLIRMWPTNLSVKMDVGNVTASYGFIEQDTTP